MKYNSFNKYSEAVNSFLKSRFSKEQDPEVYSLLH